MHDLTDIDSGEQEVVARIRWPNVEMKLAYCSSEDGIAGKQIAPRARGQQRRATKGTVSVLNLLRDPQLAF